MNHDAGVLPPDTLIRGTPRRADRSAVERIVLLLGFALLICLRMPQIALHGRFWAEEGRFAFHDAWILPWWQAIFTPVGGYLNLVGSLSAVLARLVPLEAAPRVTNGIALLVQTCPAILLVTSRADWLRRRAVLIAALLIVATPPVSEEVWLGAITSHFHLMLCTALILVLPPQRGPLGVFQAGLLLLAPLSGPGAPFMLPVFLARAAVDRSRARLLQGAILGLGTALQLLLFYTPGITRSYGIGLPVLLCVIFVKHVLVPMLGHDEASDIAGWVAGRVAAGHIPILPVLIVLAAVGMLAAAMLRRRRNEPVWLFVAGVVFAVLSYYGAVDGRAQLLVVDFGLRYAFVPQLLFGLAVLALAATGSDTLSRVAWGVVLWLLFVGAHEYFWPSWSAFAQGPNWHAQVEQWRKDPTRPLAIWPDGWAMELPPHPR